jgi:hypothetical protein
VFFSVHALHALLFSIVWCSVRGQIFRWVWCKALHYIHYTTLHYTTLHYTTLNTLNTSDIGEVYG